MKSGSISEIRFNCQAGEPAASVQGEVVLKILVKIFCVFIAKDDFHFEILRPVLPPRSLVA